MSRIAIIEDELKLQHLLTEGLEAEGYQIDAFSTAEQAEKKVAQGAASYSLILLDLMLPGKSGSELCSDLRSKGIATPILVLTAKGAVADKVELLDVGADDYMTKPFSFEELLARIRTLLRRPPTFKRARLSVSNLMLDGDAREVTRDGRAVVLTATEFDLLHLLLERRGHVMTREDISHYLWGLDGAAEGNVVDVHMSNLRKKIDDYDQTIIKTVRGAGYLVQE